MKNTNNGEQSIIPLLSIQGKVGVFAGESTLSWNKMNGAKYYLVQTSKNGRTGWANIGEPITKIKILIKGLVPETGNFYRVAARNAIGIGAWCNPFRVMAM